MTLKQKTIENVKITAGLEIFSKILGTITSIVLARLLLPSDFGIITIVYLFLGVTDIFTELGFGSAIIHRKGQIEDALNTGFTLNLFLSICLFTTVLISAPFLATFYNSPALTSVTRVLAIGLIFSAFQFVPSVYLRKDLRFGKMAIPRFCSGLTTSIVGISLAFFGFGYWSLVYASLASTFVNVFLLIRACPCKPKIILNKQIAKELFGFGKYLVVANLIIFINLNIDNAVGGKLLGLTALGHYYLAYNWGNFSKRISGIAEKVMFPTYSKIQDNTSKLKRAYLEVIKYTSILTLPLSLGLFVISTEFVIVFLGEKWIPSIAPMRILCFAGMFSSLSGTTGSVFIAIGKPKLVRNLSFIMTITLLVFIYPLTHYLGIIGLSLVVTVSTIISSIACFYCLLKVLNLKLTQFIDSVKSAFIAVSLALLATVAVKYIISNWYQLSNQTTLISLFLTFSLIYLMTLYITERRVVLELIDMITPRVIKKILNSKKEIV
jgi:O-antigen/teichoic acid export membrane protein